MTKKNGTDAIKVTESETDAHYVVTVEKGNERSEVDITKEQVHLSVGAVKPHILTEADFENADDDGFIPAWCEERGGDQYWECITGPAVLPNKNYRYWSSRPTDEQRKAVKWE